MNFEKMIYLENDDFNLEDDLNNAQIYLIKNKINGKCYVGQAVCFTGSNNNRWGTLGRWKSHVREALKNDDDHCVLLNNAIRKYGVDNFEILTLYKGPESEIDEREIYYINVLDSLKPNGYNLKTGGDKGKNNPETIQKMKDAHTGHIHSDTQKENISKGQMGNRRGSKNRKYPEDNILPKYIRACRVDNDIKKYVIDCFPIGVEKKEYIKNIFFTISKYGSKEKALEEAIKYLDELKEEYDYIDNHIKIIKDIDNEKSATAKKEKSVKEKLPEFIYPIIEDNKIRGYYVEGILSNKDTPFPRKDFIGKTNRWNLNDATKYVEELIHYKTNNIDISDFTEIDVSGKNNKNLHEKYYLPKYVNIYNYHGVMKGFMINGYPSDEHKSGKYKKVFSDEKLTLDEKYQKCIKFLEEYKLSHPI
jgi:group I intron endonuclease